jgi:hypothetical protein
MQNELAILGPKLGVVARYGRLTNQDMARCIPPNGQKRVPDGVGAPFEFVYEVGAVIARGL